MEKSEMKITQHEPVLIKNHKNLFEENLKLWSG